MSVGASLYGAIQGSKNQREATAANLRAAQETNEANYRMFREGRGATGSAILPFYFGDQEKQLSQDAGAFYNASKNLAGTPQEQYQRYAQSVAGYKPMQDAAKGTLGDIFSGQMTNQRLGYLKPVAAGRSKVAQAGAEGINTALSQRINALNAAEAKKGFSGTGSFAQNRLLNAAIPAQQAAAGAISMADLQNAMDMRAIQDQGLLQKLQYMDMPFQQAQQALSMDMLPLSQVQQNFGRSLAPFEFFRMGPDSFRADPLPMIGADTMGPAIANALGNSTWNAAQLAQQQWGRYGAGAGAGAAGTAAINYPAAAAAQSSVALPY